MLFSKLPDNPGAEQSFISHFIELRDSYHVHDDCSLRLRFNPVSVCQ